MALRPEIALQTQSIKLPDFAGAYESVLNNRARRENLDQNRQLHNAQMQEYQRKTAAAQAQAERDSVTRAKLAGGATAKDIMGDDPELAMKLGEAEQKQAQAEIEAKLKNLEIMGKNAERGAGIASSIFDNASLIARLDEIEADPELSKAVPQQIRQKLRAEGYTPENRQLIRKFRNSVLTEKDRIDDERADAQLALSKQAEERQQKELLMKQKREPLELLDLENRVKTGTPDPVTLLTPQQKATLGLQRDQFGETQRHNKVAEGLQAQGVNIQKQKLEMDKIEKEALAKGMSQESAKVYAIAETGIPELEQLRDAIKASPRKAIAGILTGGDTKLSRLAENAADKVGRLRSGGAVNPSEEQRFISQIARKMDLIDGDGKSAVEAINNYITEFKTVKTKMLPGGKTVGTTGSRPPLSSFEKK